MRQISFFLLFTIWAVGVFPQAIQSEKGDISNRAVQSVVASTHLEVAAEQINPIKQNSEIAERALLAMSALDYPLTPGDVLILKYLRLSSLESMSIFVENDGMVNLGFLGRIQSRGMNYRDFKILVERKVSEAYIGSSPSLMISSTGLFTISLEGETPSSGIIKAWGLMRLSDVIDQVKTPYTSIRKIKIVEQSGKETEYDLFRAIRNGEMTQNPYLHPGDRLILTKAARIVKLEGEIRRPSSYEVSLEDTLATLIDFYGDGFTALADPLRITLIRHRNVEDPAGQKKVLSFSTSRGYQLEDYDTVIVASTQDLLPVVYFEGAVGVGVQGQSAQTSQRMPYTYYPGETLGSSVRNLRPQFSAVSDLANSYIIRGSERISVDLSKYLYDVNVSSSMGLEKNDIIIVPFRQFFVSVSGAVKLPGRYPYIPDRGWEYYIGLAGGFDTERNSADKLNIINVQGQAKHKGQTIEPEDTLIAASNSFLYSFGRFATILSTIISVIGLLISLKVL